MRTTILLVLVAVCGCGGTPAGTQRDSGDIDVGIADGGADSGIGDDGGGMDAGTADGDGGELDLGSADGGELDSGSADGGELDSGSADGGELDSGSADGGELDSGTVDGGRADAGRLVRLSGGVQKGPFIIGSSVGISTISSVGSPTGALFSTMTFDDLGDFAVAFSYLGSVSLEAAGYYYNESTGALSGAPLTLRAYHEVTTGGAQSAYVNLITHLSYGRVGQLIAGGSTIESAADQAERELRDELGIGPAGFTPEAPGIYLNVFGGDSDSNAYLLAVSAALTGAGITRGGADAGLQELLAVISTDLAPDGLLAGTVKAEIDAAYRAVDGDRVMGMFRARIAAVGGVALVPNIHRMLDTDSDGVFNASDNCRGAPNPGQENWDGDAWGDACDDNAPLGPVAWRTSALVGTATAWGDVDGDGDLDLATAGPHLFRNEGGVLTTGAVWNPVEASLGVRIVALAWGDVDGDGDLDLATAGDRVRLYRNDVGTLTNASVWTPLDSSPQSVAWGDVDGDGDLDLAVAATGTGYILYRNDAGAFASTVVWRSTDGVGVGTVAWGDVDGDGDLDLAAGDRYCRLYRNDGGSLTGTAVWTSTNLDFNGHAVAWGDIDRDGDLDLVTGTNMHRNDGGTLATAAVWTSTSASMSPVALADVDEDGDLDLVNVGSLYRPALHLNGGGMLATTSVWSPPDGGEGNATNVAWGDLDGDGDVDLAVGCGRGIVVYVNTLR